MKKLVFLLFIIISQGCTAMTFKATNKKMDLEKFMGPWYVQSGRVTFLESGAHNPTETYTYDDEKKIINIDFKYNKDSLNGPLKKIPQTGTVQNFPTNTHWKISPIWPLKFDYLVLDFADDYSWCAIGVPSGKYLWIMTRAKNNATLEVDSALKSMENLNYPLHDLEIFKHNP